MLCKTKKVILLFEWSSSSRELAQRLNSKCYARSCRMKTNAFLSFAETADWRGTRFCFRRSLPFNSDDRAGLDGRRIVLYFMHFGPCDDRRRAAAQARMQLGVSFRYAASYWLTLGVWALDRWNKWCGAVLGTLCRLDWWSSVEILRSYFIVYS